MEYAERVRAFERMRRRRPVSANAAALWYYLAFAICEERDGEGLAVSNVVLAEEVMMSASSLWRARNELTALGLIHVEGGKGKKPVYRMADEEKVHENIHHEATVEKNAENGKENVHEKVHKNVLRAGDDLYTQDRLVQGVTPVTHTPEEPRNPGANHTKVPTPIVPSRAGKGSRAEQAARAEKDERFLRFYSAYPRKEAKKPAALAFAKIDPDEKLLAEIMAGLERDKQSEQWRREGGKYIPFPATWLNQARWDKGDGCERQKTQANAPVFGWGDAL